jgi:hypothetical protein
MLSIGVLPSELLCHLFELLLTICKDILVNYCYQFISVFRLQSRILGHCARYQFQENSYPVRVRQLIKKVLTYSVTSMESLRMFIPWPKPLPTRVPATLFESSIPGQFANSTSVNLASPSSRVIDGIAPRCSLRSFDRYTRVADFHGVNL